MRAARWRNALLTLLVLCASCAPARGEGGSPSGFYEEMPALLRVSQHMQTEQTGRFARIQRTYPETANPGVDAEIAALVDEMAERHAASLAEGTKQIPSYLDVGAVISRTGASFMSFLTLAEIACQREQISVDYDARVYDMQTGERITLADVFPQESEAWAMLARAVRRQLTGAFPGETPNEAALSALCSEEALRHAPFLLGAARLDLVYRADAVYPGKRTLLHVTMDYADIRPFMTERAFAQTDNSRFRKIALTYDDGGALSYTRAVLDALRMYGAGATFFVVGEMMGRNHNHLCRQQDAGYSIQTHTYSHRYPYEMTDAEILEERERMARELSAVTGIAPTLMRAPGGMEKDHLRLGTGYPLIHWSLASGDSGNPHADRIAKFVCLNADDGDIVLLHDINPCAGEYTAAIARELSRRGFLMVTVEELFADAGIALEEGKVYFSTRRIEDSARK